MSTLGELRAEVFTRLAQAEGELFSKSEANTAINREREHLHTEINMKNDEYLAKQVTFATAGTGALASVTPYAFPTDFNKLLSMELLKTDRWEPIPYVSVHSREMHRNRRNWLENSVNVYYYIVGVSFYLVPDIEPPTAAVGDNVRMVYIYLPVALTADSDVPTEIPRDYHELLELGASNRLRKSAKEPPIDLDEYNAKLMQMSETLAPRVKHNPKQIRMVSSGLY